MSYLRRSSLLHCSVSAGALAIAVVTATPASAANQCGAPTSGVVQCDTSDAPFDQGIDYAVDGNLTLNVADGLVIAPDAMFSGIVVSAPTGSVVINASGADFASENAGAIGVSAGSGAISRPTRSTPSACPRRSTSATAISSRSTRASAGA